MFDFDGLETEDPSPDAEELYHDVVQRIAHGLQHAVWKERCDACRLIPGLRLGQLASALLPTLKNLCDADPDFQVRKAARKALDALREEGVSMPAGATQGAVVLAREEIPETATTADGAPRAHFEIFKEVLSMRLEQECMTPMEITKIWERRWGVQYAGRIRFRAQPDAEAKWLNPREDTVPYAPLVVKLDAGAGSILYSLATAMRQYGEMTGAEAEAERARRLSQKVTVDPRPEGRPKQDSAEREERQRLRRPWREGPPLLAGPATEARG